MSVAGKILRVEDSHPRSWFVCMCEQRFPTLDAHEQHKFTAILAAEKLDAAIRVSYAHALWKIVS